MMGLEASTTITGLNAAWPLGTDPKSAGDDHLRLIKNVLKLDAYRRDNILGTVTQASGVPTGAIFEKGSNANGQFLKYADGSMIQTFQAIDQTGIIGATGSLFRSPNSFLWTFPVPFLDTVGMFVSITPATGSGRAGGFFLEADPPNWGCSFRLWASSSLAAGAPGIMVQRFAMGRWF